MKYYVALYEWRGYECWAIQDYREFQNLRKARRFMRRTFRENVAAECPSWFTPSSLGVEGDWRVSLERGENLRKAVLVK